MKRIKPGKTETDYNEHKKTIHPEEWEVDYLQTWLSVYGPYAFFDTSTGLRIPPQAATIATTVIASAGDNLFELQRKRVSTKRYNPFAVRALFEKMDKIQLDNLSSILIFCNEYGLLGEEIMKRPSSLRGVYSGVYGKIESLDFFIREVQELKNCLKIYNCSRSPDQNFKLMITVNKYLATVSPRVQLLPDGSKLLPGQTSATLLGAVYYQLYELFGSGAELKECPLCGSYFTPRTHRSNFCPTPEGEGYTRSPCENRYNQMVHWSREKYMLGKKTVEEIAAMKKRPATEVQQWLDGYERR